jgi:hypothetical protein
MKRFDFANEVAKQLITISSAIITVVIAFYDKFFSHSTPTFVLVIVVLLFFIASIVTGVLSIGGLTNQVEKQEHHDWEKGGSKSRRTPFVKLDKSSAQYWARWQQGLFTIGLLLFITVAILDRTSLFENTPSPKDAMSDRSIVWAQLRPDTDTAKGQLIARAIVARGSACPRATVDGKTLPMERRADGSDPDFPVKLCEIAVPGTANTQIGDVTLKPRPQRPRKIVVIGDTGCRITDYTAQLCDSAADWPFSRVAVAAAKEKPDLIIDVGDYHYREKPCAGRPGCGGSPYGDNWRTWDADFFVPVAPLLTAAPWLMVRGNHEDCTRAGAGWYLLLAPTLGMPPGLRCPPDTDPDVLKFDGLRLVALDTASAEGFGREKRVKKYREQLLKLQADLDKVPAPAGETWLLLHHPLWVSQGRKKDKTLFESDLYDDLPATLDEALRARLSEEIVNPIDTVRQWADGKRPIAAAGKMTASKALEQAKAQPAGATKPPALAAPNFALVLSGHIHTFQTFVPDDATAPLQLVAGNSGDVLDSADKFPGAITKLEMQPAILFGRKGTVSMRHVFGFVVLERADGAASWTATLHDVDGQPIVKCELKRSGGCRYLQS